MPAPRHIREVESDGFLERLQEVLGDESNTSFSKRCGFTEGTLRNYLAGADPSRKRLIAMAEAGAVSLEWLATGRGDRHRRPEASASGVNLADQALLTLAVEAVTEGLASIGRTMPPRRYAELVCAAYQLMGKLQGAEGRGQVIQFIKAAA